MDERVKLLAGKALNKAVPETWTTLSYDQTMRLLGQFADLIVNDCLAECWYDKTPLEISNSIRTKFGMPTVG